MDLFGKYNEIFQKKSTEGKQRNFRWDEILSEEEEFILIKVINEANI